LAFNSIKHSTVEDKKINIWQPLIYAGLLAAGIVGGFFIQGDKKSFSLTGNDKIDQVMSLINSTYVDTVDGEALSEVAIESMLHDLDPHSNYIPAAELASVNEQLEGNFEGIGVEFNLLNDTIFIATVLPEGPSEKVGLMPGDRIITVDKENVAGIGITNSDVIKKLKGKKGTQVVVGIKRSGVKEILSFTINRDRIPLKSVEIAYMATPTTGYLKINSFAKDTYDELKEGLTQLKKQGMQDLILDLRGNPGGYLHIAAQITSEFLGKNKLMVYTEGRTQNKKDYTTDHAGDFTNGKLIILVDEGSASASEIVSGAIQDWDRGLIVGRRTFGKGLVQESFSLKDGSAVRLNIARYYTPTGRSIQKPYDHGYDDYENEITERYTDGELDNPDSVKKNEKLVYKTPAGRKVYGGGGIYPDVFVPRDSALHSQLVVQVYRNGIITRLAYQYADNNRTAIKNTYKNADGFSKNFVFDNQLENKLRALLAGAAIQYKETELKNTLPYIGSQVNALIARQVFGKSAYYQALNNTDATFNAALGALTNYDALLKGVDNKQVVTK
jgi:carboxyl-terminal processing protease